VDHTKQLPLPVDSGFTPETESVQALVGANIGKYRFHCRHAMSVDLFAVVAVDPVPHPVREGGLAFIVEGK